MRKFCVLHMGQTGDAAWVRVWPGSPAFKILVAIALAALQLAASAASDKAVYLIDNFDGPTALQGWRFYGTPESPAAVGGLALGLGHSEHGAVLSYRLACDWNTSCDAYAAAFWTPASPLPKNRDRALSLWIRFPPKIAVFLEVKDSSGQTLQFPLGATIEHPKVGDGQYVVVPLSPNRCV